MTSTNPLKRKECDDTTSAWSCPVCMCSVDDAAGLVPMASTGCAPAAAHMVCLACFKQLPVHKTSTGAELVDCPTCRARTTFLVLLPLIEAWNDPIAIEASTAYQCSIRLKRRAVVRDHDEDDDADAVVLAAVEAAAAERAQREAAAVVPQSMPLPLSPSALSDEERQSRRLDLAIDAIQRVLDNWQGNDPQMAFYDKVPEWDRDRVRLVCRAPGHKAMSRVQLRTLLTDISCSVLPMLREVFAASGFTIGVPGIPVRSRSGKYGEFVYLAFVITRQTPVPVAVPQPRSMAIDSDIIHNTAAPVSANLASVPVPVLAPVPPVAASASTVRSHMAPPPPPVARPTVLSQTLGPFSSILVHSSPKTAFEPPASPTVVDHARSKSAKNSELSLLDKMERFMGGEDWPSDDNFL
jgi:hypothetical protein